MGILTLTTSNVVMESKLVFEAKMWKIKNYKKNSVGQGAPEGTIQENSQAADCPGNSFSREKSKENAPITGGLRDTTMGRNVLGT